MLSMRSVQSATVLCSNSYYTVVASIFLVSAASCKAMCGVASVRTRGGRKVLTFANHLEGLIIFTTEAQCSQCIHNTTMNIIKPSR